MSSQIYNCISAYIDPENINEWYKCPRCHLKPKVWEFDNGRSTACGCWENTYDHFSIKAKPIMDVYREDNGSLINYDSDELKNNWNEYCKKLKAETNQR